MQTRPAIVLFRSFRSLDGPGTDHFNVVVVTPGVCNHHVLPTTEYVAICGTGDGAVGKRRFHGRSS
ncbi:hypothetical protein IMZ48_27825 [Candidatus Bathyarchaeota archaeon]|nr:hypothetical protein [Candidatus Bathyarchaeota archaeon]